MLWTKPLIGILLGRIATTLISSTMSVSIGWHLYQATRNAFDLALIGLFLVLPIFAFTPLTGWVADHFSRRKILLATSLMQLAVLVSVALIMMQPTLNKWYLFLTLSVLGGVRAFFAPAMQSILPNIVPAEQLNRAVALVSSSWNFALTIGPFIAGLLIAWIDRDLYWWLILVGFFTFGGFWLLPEVQRKTRRQAINFSELMGGVAYLRENRIVLGCMTIDLLIVFFGSVMAILPVFVTDVLHAGPETLGLLRAMPATGATLMGLFLTGRKEAIKNNGQILFIALTIFASSIIVFSLFHYVWIAALALFVYGASDMVSVVLRSAIVQICTPDNLRGRVSALNTLFIASSNELGDFRSGSVTALIGPVAGSFVGGLMAFGVVGLSLIVFKPLRQLGEIKPPESQAR